MSCTLCHTYYDPYCTSQNSSSTEAKTIDVSHAFSLRVVNEMTWETEKDSLRISFTPNAAYVAEPLYLLDGQDQTGIFQQASILRTDRFSYIGVMLQANTLLTKCSLLNDSGDVIAQSNGHRNYSGSALSLLQLRLFPYESDDPSQNRRLFVLAIDASVPLPGTLHFRFTSDSAAVQPSLRLSATPADASSANGE